MDKNISYKNGVIQILDEEQFFKSDKHKYCWVRKYFAKIRRSTLFYQPSRLLACCAMYKINDIINAINKTMSKRSSNYFVSFLEHLGETRSYGGWKVYSFDSLEKSHE